MGKKTWIAILLSGCILASIGPMQVPEGCAFPVALRPFLLLMELLKVMGRLNVIVGGDFSAPVRLFEHAEPELKNTSELEILRQTIEGVETQIYRPLNFSGGIPGSAMIFLHGGGFTVGSAKTHSRPLMKVAKKTGMVVFALGYRLAPERLFPAAFEDCLAVTKAVLKQAPKYGVDARKIVLSGDSAGGNLAVAVSFALGQEESPNPICVMNPMYPTLQMVNFRLPSYMQNPSSPVLDRGSMINFFLSYMGFGKDNELESIMTKNGHMEGYDQNILDRIDAKWIPDRFKKREVYEEFELVPMEAYDLFEQNKQEIQKLATDVRLSVLVADDELFKLLPNAYTLTCEFDVLRDDGIILHERLKALGKNSTLMNLEFGSHGVLGYYGLGMFEEVDHAIDEMLENIMKIVQHC